MKNGIIKSAQPHTKIAMQIPDAACSFSEGRTFQIEERIVPTIKSSINKAP